MVLPSRVPAGNHAVAQVSLGRILRIEEVHLPGGVVIQARIWRRECPSRYIWRLRRRLRPRCNYY